MNRAVYFDRDAYLNRNQALGIELPYAQSTNVLKQSLSIQGKIIHNRIACQAMEGCDGTKDGCPSEMTNRRYMRFAKGGAGLIWYEATAVLPEGRANPRQLYIHKGNVEAFKTQIQAIKEAGLRENGYEPIIIMQATHSGRYSKPEGTPAPIIAYNNPIFEGDTPIAPDRIATDAYLDQVRDALIQGAVLAKQAGFDGVDIKCCHRYLLSELLSAYDRPGKYGGSYENRTRLLRESIQGAIDACGPDFIVTTRLNVYDGFPKPYGFGVSDSGEISMEEPIRLLQSLKEMGVHLVNISMGNPYFNAHVNRPFALGAYEPGEHPMEGVARVLQHTAALKKAVPEMHVLCSAISYLGTQAPHVVAAYIEAGQFDLAGFGRTIFAYPDFAKDILTTGEMRKEKSCICCSKCTELMRGGSTPGCVIRDELYQKIYKEWKCVR